MMNTIKIINRLMSFLNFIRGGDFNSSEFRTNTFNQPIYYNRVQHTGAYQQYYYKNNIMQDQSLPNLSDFNNYVIKNSPSNKFNLSYGQTLEKNLNKIELSNSIPENQIEYNEKYSVYLNEQRNWFLKLLESKSQSTLFSLTTYSYLTYSFDETIVLLEIFKELKLWGLNLYISKGTDAVMEFIEMHYGFRKIKDLRINSIHLRSLPIEIFKHLKPLKHLYIASGPYNIDLTALKFLDSLDFLFFNFNDEQIILINCCINLKKLLFYECKFNNYPTQMEFLNYKSLVTLKFKKSRINLKILETLRKRNFLKLLVISSCEVNDDVQVGTWIELYNSIRIRCLNISGTELAYKGLISFFEAETSPTLKFPPKLALFVLNISRNNVTESDLETIFTAAKKLTTLFVCKNPIKNIPVNNPTVHFPRMKFLVLEGCNISNISWLSNFPNLTKINLIGNPIQLSTYTSSDLADIRVHQKENLKSIALDRCNLYREDLILLSILFFNIKHLSCDENPNITLSRKKYEANPLD